MRPTTYASTASCRHIMALPWKHKSYLPTSRAISQTSHEKGSFLISSGLFWNCQISQRATGPDWYFLVFLTLPAWRNSFWGALPPMVGQSFLLTGSSPEADGLASTAIWANYQVGKMMVTFPHPRAVLPPLPTSLPVPTSSPPPSWVRAFGLGMGWCTGEGGLLPSWLLPSALLLGWRTHLSPPLSLLGVTFVLPILWNNVKVLTNRQVAQLCSHKILPSGHFEFIIGWHHFHFNFPHDKMFF